MKLVTVIVLASISINPQAPKLGDPVPDAAERVVTELGNGSSAIRVESSILTGSSQTRPHYRLTVDETELTLGVDSNGKIVYVWVDSQDFQTPENVSVGSSLKETQKASGAEIMHEPGWGCFLPLPSGWNAYFSLECPEPLDDAFLNSATVTGLFKREGAG